jgi:hypothetical protein
MLFAQSNQIGINIDVPDSSAILHLESDSSGLLLPKLTNSEMNSINSPAIGLLINQSVGQLFFNSSDGWTRLLNQEDDGKIELHTYSRFTPSLRFRSNPRIGFTIDLDNKMKWTDESKRYFTMYQESRAFVGEVLTYIGSLVFESPSTMMLHSTKSLFEYECEPNSENYFYGLDKQGNMQTIVISQEGIASPTPVLFATKTIKNLYDQQEWRDPSDNNLITVDQYGNFKFLSSSIVFDETAGNSRLGLATLSNGAFSVTNTTVTAKDRIIVTNNKANGSVGDLYVSINPGNGFTIHSSDNLDQSEVAWIIIRSL